MSNDETIVEEYEHDCRIVREHIEGEEDRFHYEGPLGRVKSFYSPEKARLYADVHTVTGGFREGKTGERGVPPAVARAREDIVMAYLASNPTMGVKWVARAYDLSEEQVRTYIELVQKRAAEMQDGGPEEADTNEF
ncbi:hypothetical protein [Halorubrum sp. DTA98]|uniref:hypothetical protein n=1 Tax=Halorubrum sp. DTA98 TaxID=3402163 RepID=UPI003AB0F4D0